MKNLSCIFILLVLCVSCKKKCDNAGQFVVPMYLDITPTPIVKLGKDTITISASVPYSTQDMRIPGFPISLRNFKPSALFLGISACPSKDGFPIPPIDPFTNGLMEFVPVMGKKLNKNLYFDFAPSDTAWVVIFKVVPKKTFDGIFYLRTAPIQYKDECRQIDPVTVLINTPTNHYLIKERLNWPLSPYQHDVFFYIE